MRKDRAYVDNSEKSAQQLKREMLRDSVTERDTFAAGVGQLVSFINDKRYPLYRLNLEREIISLQEKRSLLKDVCTSEFELTVKSVDCDAKIEILKKILGMPNRFKTRLAEIDKQIEEQRKNLSL